MISRRYAEHWFPDFVKLVDKELEIANARAREAVRGLGTIYTARREIEEKELKPKLDTHKFVREAAALALEGKSKIEISKMLDLKFNTVRGYLQIARREGILPSDTVVRER